MKLNGDERATPKFRLPEIKTPADIDALKHLTPEEKAYGKTVLKKIPDSHGWVVMGNDPELQALWHLMEREYTALLEGDFQGIPYGPMNLIALETSRRSGNQYMYGLFATLNVRQIEAFGLPKDDVAKISLSGDPDAGVWSKEERLTIRFTHAVLDRKMSDELFAEARATWGEKRLLRLFAWINYVDMWARLSEMLNMRFSPEMLPPGMKIPPEAITGITALMCGTRKQVREFVTDKMSNFPGK